MINFRLVIIHTIIRPLSLRASRRRKFFISRAFVGAHYHKKALPVKTRGAQENSDLVAHLLFQRSVIGSRINRAFFIQSKDKAG